MEIEKGFYYHYKHDPSGSVNNYAYEVLGVGHHTEYHAESAEHDAEKYFVIYRPIYEAYVYTHGKMFDARPYQMFLEQVTKDGKTFPRFSKITDAAVIAELEKIRDTMYT